MQARKLWIPAILGLFCSAPTVHAAAPAPRVLTQSADGLHLTLEVVVADPVRSLVAVDGREFSRFHFDGMRAEGSPGAPELAVDTEWLGLPPGGSATLQVLAVQSEDLGTVRIVPGANTRTETVPTYAGQPSVEMLREELHYDTRGYTRDGAREEPARLGTPAMLRHQRVVPLEIRPLLYDPATGRARLVRSLRLQIDLRGGPPGEIEGDAAGARLATSPSWERIYAGSLLNAGTAATWRRAPLRVAQLGGALKSGLLRPGLLGEDEWKLRVRQTGPTRVVGSVLHAVGFPDGRPVGSLRVTLKRFAPARPLDPDILEIPLQVVDVNGNGNFDAEDSFIFYGQHPRDDPTSEDTLARYTEENVYWLSSVDTGSPARMPVRAPLASTSPGPTWFQQNLTYEEDHVLNKWVYGNNNDPGDSAELYFWTALDSVARVTVPVPGRQPGGLLQVCVETQEDMYSRPYQLFLRTGGRPRVLLGSNAGTFPGPFQSPPRQTTCGAALDSQIDPGDIQLTLLSPAPQGPVPLLDHVDLQYPADYTATNNRIRCTSGGSSGAVAFAITGFTDSNLRAFDITDPKAPAAFDLTGAVAAGTLTLTDDVPAGQERVYLVVPDATIPSIAAELDSRDPRGDILAELATAPFGTYDCLAVVNDAFADEPTLAQWVAFRGQQGHRIRIVRTSDVYDAFRGGLPHYEAIHRLCDLAYRNWGIQYVVLIGDGSEDPVNLLGDSGPNFVPSRVRYFEVASSSGGDAEYRNDMNDKYYAQVAGGPQDTLPDLLLGRLSVDSDAQLAAVLQKTMLYETPQPGDSGAWRKRVVMFADDEWVKRSVPNVGAIAHRRSCPELGFQTSIERASDTVDGAFPGDLHAVRCLLRNYSDQLYPRIPEHRPVPKDSTCYFASGDGEAHPSGFTELTFYQGISPGQVGSALIDSVGEGALFFALQSHAARGVVADESVLNTAERPFAPGFHNDGKPFVFFGFGCHLNEFGPPDEYGSNFPGDALGEELVNVPSRGAVASYASTGFEFLGDNNIFHETMWDVIFNKRWSIAVGGGGVDSDTLASRWLLADLLEIGEIRNASPDIIARYVLLGDPMLRLDAGVPRVVVDRIDNGFLQSDNRLVIRDSSQPMRLQITLRDEQGIDSLWVVQRYPGGVVVPVDSVQITANLDTLPQVRAKRSYTVAFKLRIDQCNFDLVVGARDAAGRSAEFVGRLLFDQRLVANGVPIRSGDRVDPHTVFRLEIKGCTPIPPPLPLAVFVDGAEVTGPNLVLRPDSVNVNWNADFTSDLTQGNHVIRFTYAGGELAQYDVQVGTFGMSEILAFPNPMRKQNAVVRIYFHLGEPIAGGSLRVLTLTGRLVSKQDLASPGVVQSDVAVPPGSIGSGVGQDATHWNWVEVFRDGLDLEGDAVANGVYLYDLQIRGLSGQVQRKRDKIVVMR